MNIPIGGYFELENIDKGNNPHIGADYLFKSGRSSINYICSNYRIDNIFLPYFICKSAIEPFKYHGIPIHFIDVNSDLELKELPELKENDYLMLVNYYGLKSNYVNKVSQKIKNLIVDNTQAFYDQLSGKFSFNSIRKYFGVADGSYFYGPDKVFQEFPRNTNYSIEHLYLRKEGKREEGFKSYREAETLIDQKLEKISSFSEKIIGKINFDLAKQKRRENFEFLQEGLSKYNLLRTELDSNSVPFCYPFLSKKPIERNELLDKGIFFPVLWPEVNNFKAANYAKTLSNYSYPLPIDQRYGKAEMKYIIIEIQNLLNA